MLSIYETYCDLRKRMFLLYGSASSVKHDPQTDVRCMAQSSRKLSINCEGEVEQEVNDD